jgi:hypothetical protein
VLTCRNGDRRGRGVRPGRGAAWGLGRKGEDGRRPSGWGADDGARLTELRRAARRLGRGRRRARERGEHERESSGRERGGSSGKFYKAREGEGEPGRNDRPSTPSMAATINSALSERSGGGRGGAAAVSGSGRRAGAAPRGGPGHTA